MHDHGEGVDRFAGDEDIHLHELLGLVVAILVVHAAVAAGHALESVVEIDEDLVERQDRGEEDPSRVERLGVDEFTALFGDEFHQFADVVVRRHDVGPHGGLADLDDVLRLGEEAGVVDLHLGAVGELHLVDDARVGRDDIHVELATEALLHDLHVEQTEEPATEPEAQRRGAFRLIAEGRIVDLEFAHGELELLEVLGRDRVDPAENHRLDLLEAGERLRRGNARVGDGVADLHLGRRFHVRDEVSHVAGHELFPGKLLGGENADFLDFVGLAGGHHADRRAALDLAAHDPDVADDAAIGVEDRVENERPKNLVGRLRRSRDPLHDRLEDVFDPDAHLRAGLDRLVGRDCEDLLELAFHRRNIRAREVDLVDHGNDVEPRLVREVHVRHGLRLDALGCVDEEEGAFTGGERAAHLVGEIDVTGRVREVQLISLPILREILHRDRVRLDRDPALPLEIHRVEELVLLLPLGDGRGRLEETVGERGLPVIDVGDDGEIPCQFNGHRQKAGNLGAFL